MYVYSLNASETQIDIIRKVSDNVDYLPLTYSNFIELAKRGFPVLSLQKVLNTEARNEYHETYDTLRDLYNSNWTAMEPSCQCKVWELLQEESNYDKHTEI